jgi:hypothetical protein|tara:strand:+ start:1901 stop:2056 length:156 start_codon:yes stop_codon:yes gene_type:complete
MTLTTERVFTQQHSISHGHINRLLKQTVAMLKASLIFDVIKPEYPSDKGRI